MVFQVSVQNERVWENPRAAITANNWSRPRDRDFGFGFEIGPIRQEVSGLAGLEGQDNLDLTSFCAAAVVVVKVVDVVVVVKVVDVVVVVVVVVGQNFPPKKQKISM